MLDLRWAFTRTIFEDPIERTNRIPFIDWLLENGHKNAAQRQKEYITLLHDVLIIEEWIKDQKNLWTRTKSGKLMIITVKLDGECDINPRKLSEEFMLSRVQLFKDYWTDKPIFREKIRGNHTINAAIAKRISWVKPELLKD